MNTQPSSSARPERIYYVDWLRVLAVLLLVPFHTARIFDIWEPFYAKNAQVSKALTYTFIGMVNPWHMPLFFLLAGASTRFALRFRSSDNYVGERFKRLVVPLIFGVLVLVPPQSYLGARTYGYFDGSFFRYYPQFFQIGATGDLTGYMGGFTPAHLWFILFLFVLSLVALPLLLHLRREAGQRLIAGLAVFFTRPGMIFLPAIPLALTTALPDIGGKNPFYYLALFICGYILMADARFAVVLDKHKTPALLFGLGTRAAFIVLAASDLVLPDWSELILGLFYVSMGWSFLIAILGFGRKYLNFATRTLEYASRVAYPFYIFHQPVIVIVGFYVVQWDASVPAKFLIIVVTATAATLLLCEAAKLTNLTRSLFGVKPLPKEPPISRSVKQAV